jgi:hypothetical protein
MMFRWIKNFLGATKGYGGCLKCKDRWTWKSVHDTAYSATRGCFTLCEPCWQGATPGEIRHYYSEIVRMWRRDGSFYNQEFEDDLVSIALKEKNYAV